MSDQTYRSFRTQIIPGATCAEDWWRDSGTESTGYQRGTPFAAGTPGVPAQI